MPGKVCFVIIALLSSERNSMRYAIVRCRVVLVTVETVDPLTPFTQKSWQFSNYFILSTRIFHVFYVARAKLEKKRLDSCHTNECLRMKMLIFKLKL